MKTRCIGVGEYDLLNYLNRNWRGFDTKDYELLIAVYLCRFHKKMYGGKYRICIPVKYDAARKVGIEYSRENIEKILKSYTNEDTPVDIFITSEKDIKEISPIGNGKGLAYQLKRIRENSEKDKTKSILKFLKDYIPNKYGDTDASLVLVVGESGDDGELHLITTNLKKITEEFNPRSYPFRSVLLVSNTLENQFFVCELWPNFFATKIPFRNHRFLR